MKNGTWVVVADGKKALFLHNHGDDDIIDLRVLDAHTQTNPATHDQGTDQPGRTNDAAGPGKSAMEATDWHQLAEDRFAHLVADDLNRAALANRFAHAIIVAPPKALAEIRKHLHKETVKRVAGEVNKDLTGHPVWEIEKILKSV